MTIPKIVTGLLAVVMMLVVASAYAQPFASDIRAFKKADSLAPPFPGRHAILFVGSSTFTKWTDVQSYFPAYPIINRGFGGSTLPDVIRYATDIIIPYAPKQILIYCGDNDLASSDSITPAIILNRFKKLFGIIRKALPYVQIDFVSIKPSPSRLQLMSKASEANKMVKAFLKMKTNTAFIDTYTAMLGANGKPMPDIFIEDQLHMNAKGYAIWQKIIEPYLLK